MQVRVQIFATLVQQIGHNQIDVELTDGATVGDMLEIIGKQHPSVVPLLGRIAVAVNLSYVKQDHPLSPEDEVALIPPVSGGAR